MQLLKLLEATNVTDFIIEVSTATLTKISKLASPLGNKLLKSSRDGTISESSETYTTNDQTQAMIDLALTPLNTKVTSIEGINTANAAKINNMQGGLNTLGSSLTNLTNTVNAMDSELDELTGKHNALMTTSVNSVSKMISLESLISDLASRVARLEVR